MVFIGIDLSGPSNIKDTACACFQLRRGQLGLLQTVEAATDKTILELATVYADRTEFVVGLDAPLSYNPGGGDRPSDKALRRRIANAGLHPGSVMAPTMTRMAYLTLRGMAVARILTTIRPQPPNVVEVHPGGTMALRGAPIQSVREFKQQMPARLQLMDWLQQQGLSGQCDIAQPSDHLVAACATALAAWKWHVGESVWRAPAEPPLHPFDYTC